MSIKFVIYCDLPVICRDKQGRKYCGDVPVLRYNETTHQFEDVVNLRGAGYAGRTRLRYRKRRTKGGEIT